ncbi:hypothetical protein TanjilG_20992 [Lupinus angustifolius]|uniref:Uncharacterized protein n=1 Tax=Lupinus angustifolius TaxID=3871 RepID=A0A1J7I958_LUPAN|nr:hypothetical protein TanjilG_20992 [Lupinus angustifolius]
MAFDQNVEEFMIHDMPPKYQFHHFLCSHIGPTTTMMNFTLEALSIQFSTKLQLLAVA